MTPEWSDFRVLLALARAGSVAGAARELQVDNTTIGRRLAALEEAAGVKLLLRDGREFAWTAEGRILIEAAEAMEATTTRALSAVRTAKVDLSGAVRVSVAPGFLPVLMRRMLPALREAHPLLNVELNGGFHRVDLAKGDADIALRMAQPEEPDLVACHVFDCAWFAYAAASYLEERGRPATFDDLAQHELVLYTEALHRVPPLRWMEAYRGTARDLTRVDNLEIACQTISAGGGIAVLPCFIADPVPGLRRVFPDRVAVNPGWVVYHESARDTARVRAVVDALVEFFRTHEASFSGAAAHGGRLLAGASARCGALVRELRTVLFTDIVSSTARLAAVGDHAWHELLAQHHAIVRRQLDHFDGREVDTAGDGFLATLDSPAQALACACEIITKVNPLGIAIRAGIHTGECEVLQGKISGIAVHIGARIAGIAGPSELLVSSTVKDLVAGSGITFDDRGAHVLRGVPGEWRLFAVHVDSVPRTMQ